MYSEKFEKAIEYVLANEGCYVFDKNDPGGETKYGISQRAYPTLNIRALTLDEAKEIYHRDYWLKCKIDQIANDIIATKLFDLSVNFGVNIATIIAQRALRSCDKNVTEDGIIGPQTISAINETNAQCLFVAMKSEAAGYYRFIVVKNPNQKKFLHGWLNRAYKQIIL